MLSFHKTASAEFSAGISQAAALDSGAVFFWLSHIKKQFNIKLKMV